MLPVLLPLQSTLTVCMDNCRGSGVVIVALPVMVQLLESVTVTVYVAGGKLEILAVVSPPVHK